MCSTFGDIYIKASPNSSLFIFSPTLYPCSLIVLHFKIRSLKLYELIFVKHVRFLSRLFSFSVFNCYSSFPFIFFFTELLFFFSQISFDYICINIFWGSLFCSSDLFVNYFTNTTVSTLL